MTTTPDVARAAVLTDVRRIEMTELALPTIGDDDGLMRVEACGICGADYPVFAGTEDEGGMLRIRPPVILGHEIVGRVERIGARASRRWGVDVGDRIVVERWIPCGHCEFCYRGEYRLCIRRVQGGAPLCYGGAPTTEAPGLFGGYAEYLYLHPDSVVYPVEGDAPAHLFPLFTPLANALCWLREFGELKPGGSVVIQGPGQEGLAAVIAAREAGAHRIVVTGLRQDEHRLALASELGATATVVVDDEDDAVVAVRSAMDGRSADVVLDVTSGPTMAPVELATEIVGAGGIVVLATDHAGGRALSGRVVANIMSKVVTVRGVRGRHRWAIFAALRLIESRRYPLERLCSGVVTLEEVGAALAAVGREGDEDVLHVAVEP